VPDFGKYPLKINKYPASEMAWFALVVAVCASSQGSPDTPEQVHISYGTNAGFGTHAHGIQATPRPSGPCERAK
jgi:hypothetical protein